MTSEVESDVYLIVFRRANNMAENGNLGEINWETLKADLERPSDPQLKLVFELVEHMREVNEEDSSEVILQHNY